MHGSLASLGLGAAASGQAQGHWSGDIIRHFAQRLLEGSIMKQPIGTLAIMHTEQTSHTYTPASTAHTPQTHPTPQTTLALTLSKHYQHIDTTQEILRTHPHSTDTHTQPTPPHQPMLISSRSHIHPHTFPGTHTHTPPQQILYTSPPAHTCSVTFITVGGHAPG